MASELTVAQLERMLNTKRSMLDSLQKKRSKLGKQLETIDRRIAAIGGTVRDSEERPSKVKLKAKVKARVKGRKRPRNEKTLLQVVTDVLQENKKGLVLGDLAKAVLATGYKSGSAHFPNTVYQCLYNNSDNFVQDSGTKAYRLK